MTRAITFPKTSQDRWTNRETGTIVRAVVGGYRPLRPTQDGAWIGISQPVRTLAEAKNIGARYIRDSIRFDLSHAHGQALVEDAARVAAKCLTPEFTAEERAAIAEDYRTSGALDDAHTEALEEAAVRALLPAATGQPDQVRVWLERHEINPEDVHHMHEALVADHVEALREDTRRHAARLILAARVPVVASTSNKSLVGARPVPAADSRPAEVRPTGSGVVTVLEKVWTALRNEHPELPAIVIVTGSMYVGPPRWGHFRAAGWTDRSETEAAADLVLGELFIAGEALAKGARHVLETVLHEAAHALAQVRGVQDTSRQGRWHNAKFRALAEELGLEYDGKIGDPKIGFSEMLLSEATDVKYAPLVRELDEKIRLVVALKGEEGGSGGEHVPGGRKQKAEGSSSNGLKLVCGCETPRIIRASKSVAALGTIRCGECDEDFGIE